jgi:uroporphyrinogen-III synthase
VSDLPLHGRRILVTRATHQAGKLSEALRALGAVPVEVPVLKIVPPASYDPLDQALRHLDQYDWLILTSSNTVRVLADRAAAIGVKIPGPHAFKVAAVGEATAKAAGDLGFLITFVPVSYVSESLIEGLLEHVRATSGAPPNQLLSHAFDLESRLVTGHDFSRADSTPQDEGALAPAEALAGQKILIARAAIARDVIPDALRATGAHVDVVDAYRNILPESAPERLRQALDAGLDAATFTSSSSVTHLAEAAHKAGVEFPFPGVPAISIGPITSQTLREHNWPPAAEAIPSDVPGLVTAVANLFSQRSS